MQHYAVIGNPIHHSLSPKIHTLFAEQAGIPISYVKIESPVDQFESIVTAFFYRGGHGCNITLPFKAEAFKMAAYTSAEACSAGAVNCLTSQSGAVWGDNFDGLGLVNALTNGLGMPERYCLAGRDILIIGAGGAARGVVAPLLAQFPRRIVIANRTMSSAVALAQHYGTDSAVDVMGVGLDAISDPVSSPVFRQAFDLVIHATAVGHVGSMPVFSSKIIGRHSCCYDLSYGSAALPFLKWAVAHGVQYACDGLGMLVEQAAASFTRWHGVAVPREVIRSVFSALAG